MSRRSRQRNAPPPVAPTPPRSAPRWPKFAVFAAALLLTFGAAYAVTKFFTRLPDPPAGMVWIPLGEFMMGSADKSDRQLERPAHRVKLDGFWMDEHEVTNAEFRRFVETTGYVTTAEKPVDGEGLKRQLPPNAPPLTAQDLVPSSMVFRQTDGPVPLDEFWRWWRITPGANWRHPEGPDSDLTGRDDHPVVHVSWDDAVAYAKWAGKRLPTEAEWEYAARGGLAGKRFTWGDEAPTETDGGKANIWQGKFPYQNTKADGWERTAPVKSFPPNGYGLYDMAGNVWEWCNDRYRADAYEGLGQLTVNPKGPDKAWNPGDELSDSRVLRGGSFLCHVTYCESYRPAARRGNAPDTGMCHLGFRCVKDVAAK